MNFSLTARIHATPERVYTLGTDLENWPKYIKEIVRVEKLTPGPVAVGTRFKETRMMFGKETTEEMTFTAIDPQVSYTLEAISCGCQFQSTFRLAHAGSETDLTLSFTSKPLTFFAKLMKPLAFLMVGMMRKCMQGDLDQLKAAAEKEA